MRRLARRALPALAATGLLAGVGTTSALAAGTVNNAGGAVTYSQTPGTNEANNLLFSLLPGAATGTNDDVLEVTDRTGNVITPSATCVNAGAQPQSNRVRCQGAPTGFSSVTADTGTLDDVIEVVHYDGNLRLITYELTGGTGDDTISAANDSRNANTLVGGEGDDILTGSPGTSRLQGGPGEDDLRGGTGFDTADYTDKTTATAITLGGLAFDDGTGCSATGAKPAGCEGDNVAASIENVDGGSGDDVIVGVGGRNTFTGNGGNDTLRGLGGDDFLTGGAGDDTLEGGDGDDRVLSGEAGNDTIRGGDGEDQPTGGDGADMLFGDAGNDELTGGAGADSLEGGADNDALTGGADADTLDGGSGTDTLAGEAGNDLLRGGPDADSISGGGNVDTITYSERTAGVTVSLEAPLRAGDTAGVIDGPTGDTITADIENAIGGAGDDVLRGSPVANRLEGGAGADTLNGGTENDPATDTADVFVGGAGRDLADYSARPANQGANPQPNNLTLDPDGAADDGFAAEGDTIGADVEDISAGAANDTITGSAEANTLKGGAGNDTITGLAGDDGLDGEAGTDTLSYADRAGGQPVTVNLNATGGQTGETDTLAGFENLTGGNGADDLRGDDANNRLAGGDGADRLVGRGGADPLVGGGGIDTADYSADGRTVGVTVTTNNGANDGSPGEGDDVQTENVIGTAFDDSLTGDSTGAPNLLEGLAGADVLFGNADGDTLRGGDGTDTLSGDGGNDELDGGTGADSISGSAGNDTVTYLGRTGDVRVDLTDPSATQGVSCPGASCEGDMIQGVENATGGLGADTLIGDGTTNVLRGSLGDDTLDGGPGVVADTLDGGDGTDTVDYAARMDAIVLTLAGGANDGAAGENDAVIDVENGITGSGADTVTGSPVVNRVRTNAGDDTIDVRDAVADDVDCGDGADTVTTNASDTVALNCETNQTGPRPSLSVSDVTIAERNMGSTNATFTLTLDRTDETAGQEVQVVASYATRDQTATAGQDYTATTGQVTFAPNETTKTVDVPVLGDATVEPDETFELNVSSAPGATIGDGTGVGTITNDDTFPTATVNDVRVTEGDTGTSTATFTVRLSRPSDQELSVRYRTSTAADDAATAPTDFTATEGVVTFAAGQTSQSFDVLVNGDTAVEPEETFTVTLSDPDPDAAPAFPTTNDTAKGIIENDDADLTVGDVTVTEGDAGTTNATFTVTRTGVNRAVTFDIATADGTAVSPGDYVAQALTGQTIPAGASTYAFTVQVNGDGLVEGDETFTANLTNVVGATATDPSGTATIDDDDAQPTLTVSDEATAEGDAAGSQTFTVTASRASSSPVSVTYTASSESGDSATAGTDYTAVTGTATIAAGETTTTFSVPISGDRAVEPNETYTVTLSAPMGATLGNDPTGTGTIVNDDSALTIDDVTVTEGNTGTTDATFTVTRTGAAKAVAFSTRTLTTGTATSGTDYEARPATAGTIAADATTAQVTVKVVGDTLAEATEGFEVELTSNDATVTGGTGAGTITDDDGTPTVTVADAAAAEGNAGSTDLPFTLTLSRASSREVTVQVAASSASGDTATAGTDYTAASGTVTFPAGITTRTFAVPVAGDTAAEADETFTVTLSAPVNADLATDRTATGTITNDDQAPAPTPTPPSITVSDSTLAEGDSGQKDAVFTLTLSAASAGPVGVDVTTADGGANQGSDYVTLAQRVTFAPGERTRTVAVKVNGDTTVEPDETFTLRLANPSGATIARASALGGILNDDTAANPVRKVRPGLTFTTTPRRDRTAPFAFRTRGRLVLPSGTPRSACRNGRVSVQIKRGTRTLSTRRAALTSACTFSSRVVFRSVRSTRGRGALKITVRFQGTDRLLRVTRVGSARVG